jgi:hypothetical protein
MKPQINVSRDNRTVIFIEFNELSPVLLDRFISDGTLLNFRKFRDQSHCYITDAQAKHPNLEPWIQWPTVHCGMSYKEHGITRLDEGHKLKNKCVWDVLSDVGFRVWVCGAMNVSYEPGIKGALLPDPWASKLKPHPTALAPFYDFIKRNIQEHTNANARGGAKDSLSFLWFLVRNGLSLSTAKSVAQQLLGERAGVGRWRRATLLDRFQFDLFRKYYERLRPNFSIFFSNSTAHFQHMYWRNMDPDPFRVKPTPEEQSQYKEAVLFGYKQMDRLIGEFFNLAGDDAILILATALSQQPCVIYEDQGGKCIYRPRDFSSFLNFVGIADYTEIAPVMAEQFYVRFSTEESARSAESALKELMLGDRSVVRADRRGSDIFCYCQINTAIDPDTLIHRWDSDRTVPFYDLFYRIEGLKSGMHHPDGVLWIRYPSKDHRRYENKVPLINVAPTLLDLFSVAAPKYMPGDSLLRSTDSAHLREFDNSIGAAATAGD